MAGKKQREMEEEVDIIFPQGLVPRDLLPPVRSCLLKFSPIKEQPFNK
jgi:hypothetical protein